MPRLLNKPLVALTLIAIGSALLIGSMAKGLISFVTFAGIIAGLVALVIILAAAFLYPVAQEMISELPKGEDL